MMEHVDGWPLQQPASPSLHKVKKVRLYPGGKKPKPEKKPKRGARGADSVTAPAIEFPVTYPGRTTRTGLVSAIILDPNREYGPAMSRLSDPRKKFVLAFCMTGGRSNSECYRLAGFAGDEGVQKSSGWKLMQDPVVLEGIREETTLMFRGAIPKAASTLIDLLDDENPKIRLESAKELLNRGGMIIASQHNIVVEHIQSKTTEELQEYIRDYFDALPKLTHRPEPIIVAGSDRPEPVEAEFIEGCENVVGLRELDHFETEQEEAA